MAYYTQAQNQNYYSNTGHYTPEPGYQPSQRYPQQQQYPPLQQSPSYPPPSSQYRPSPSPPQSQYPPSSSPSQYPPSSSPSPYPPSSSPSQYPPSSSPSPYPPSSSPSQYPPSSSPSKYPLSPSYPSQPLQPQNNQAYGYNIPENYPYPPGNPSPQNNSFSASTPTSQANVSKPLFDPEDPKAPKAPSNYGSKYESTAYATDSKFGANEKEKYGGLMGSCCGKKCCCIICCILILIIIAVVIAVALWAKPPNIEFQGVIPSPDGLPPFQLKGSGFSFNFGLKISVNNPNIVGADFTAIRAIAFYPGHDASIGGGNLTNVHIEKQANTTINFPFSVIYDPSTDPTILTDIASKCGLTPGSQKQKLNINYLLTLSFKVLAITLSPSLNRTAEIDCPIPAGTNILGLLGIGSKGS